MRVLHYLNKPIYKERIPIVGNLTQEKVCQHWLLLAIADTICFDDAFFHLGRDEISGTSVSEELAHSV
jgi:hypothetical protein